MSTPFDERRLDLLLASHANSSQEENTPRVINSFRSDNANRSNDLAAVGRNKRSALRHSATVRCVSLVQANLLLSQRSSERWRIRGGVNGAMRFACCALRPRLAARAP